MRKALYVFDDLDENDIVWLSRHGRSRDLAPGEVLIRAGEAVSELYFVTAGSFEVTTDADDPIASLALGDAVGEMSFVEKRLPGASVTALEDSRVLAVPRDAIVAAFAHDTGFAARFYHALAVFLSDRLRSATDQDGEDEPDEVDDPQAGERFTRLVAMLDGRGV